jgi:hypothetical protein
LRDRLRSSIAPASTRFSGRVRFVAAAIFSLLALAVPAVAGEKPLRDLIDDEVRAGWSQKKLQPAPPSDDATFLRRVFLDLTGVIPTYDQARAFLDDKSTDKRAKLIDQLLSDPLYARHQADVWDLVLVGRNPPESRVRDREGFMRFLREQFEKNVAYDKLVAALLLAEGNTVDEGAPVYMMQFARRPEDGIVSITQAFLGVQLQCARCHNHPYEAWKQLDFYGMAAFLARLDVVTVGKQGDMSKFAVGEKAGGEVNFTGPAKDQQPGKKGEPVPPKFLLGEAVTEPPTPKEYQDKAFEENKPPPKPEFSRRDKLVAWLASPANPFFARAAANRFWGQFMGRGIVHPVDDMNSRNKPTHPALLDAMAKQFVDHGFDVKWLVREIVSSQAYQLATDGPAKDASPLWYERARVRPLAAEELLESWRIATGYDEAMKNSPNAAEENKRRFHGVTWDYMMQYFGTPTTGDGDFQGGLSEALYLNNGELDRLITRDKGGLIDTLMQQSGDAKIDRLFLSILTRMPTAAERQRLADYLASDGADSDDRRRDRLREAAWALMTCSEFRFNH